MKILTVADFKTNFSKVLFSLKQGKTFLISYGRNKEKVAVIMPYTQYKKTNARHLGLLEKTASFSIQSNFKMTDEEFLAS